MKTVTLREAQHNLGPILRLVDRGEEVAITRRRQVVAKLVPARLVPDKPDWTRHERELHAAFPNGPLRGSPAADLVIEQRGERA